MININGKPFSELQFEDIQAFLENDLEEGFFFEFKSDSVKPNHFAKEVSAFANTFGGYIFLGIEDNKSITGCSNWNEQKIHTVMSNNISPTPNFDCKKLFDNNGNIIFIVMIEQGTMPPYITVAGNIYERVSSGSIPIKDSSKLSELYYRHKNELERISNKIGIEPISNISNIPNNFCGYIDIGFDLISHDKTSIYEKFVNADIKGISDYLKTFKSPYSISKVGNSYFFSVGKAMIDNNFSLIQSSLQNFFEIMGDGSIKIRGILLAEDSSKNEIVNLLSSAFIPKVAMNIYKMIFGENIFNNFSVAYKYQELVVLKQFIPKMIIEDDVEDEFCKLYDSHKRNYGENLIFTSNRWPKNDYLVIDRKYFQEVNIEFSNDNLINELFRNEFYLLGYIDNLNWNSL